MPAAEPATGSPPAAVRSSAKQISPAFAAALTAGDLEAASACFARDACLITPDATTIRGRDHIRAILFQLIAMRPTVHLEQRGMLIAGDVALGTETWRIRLNGLDPTPFAQTSDSTAVLRRVEGAWKLQIAAPWGWGQTG
jgi:ketosteroid isomerase-like protein